MPPHAAAGPTREAPAASPLPVLDTPGGDCAAWMSGGAGTDGEWLPGSGDGRTDQGCVPERRGRELQGWLSKPIH